MKIEKCKNEEEIQVVLDGINSYNDSQTKRVIPEMYIPIELIAKNEKEEIIGGIIGAIGYYANFEIKILWTHKAERSKGLGAKLLRKAEEEAIKKGATIAVLDTFDFQAEQFYIKQGYTVFGKINNLPQGHYKVYLQKRF